MPHTFDIPIPPGGQTPLHFPGRCLACGGPEEARSALVVNRLAMRGRPGREKQVAVKVRYEIPHCHPCANRTKATFLAALVPFLLGMLVVGGAAFAAVTMGAMVFGLDDMGKPANANSLVLGAAAGLAAGLLGGFVFEVLARLALWPFFGSSLLRAPLLVVQLFTDADHVAGATMRPNADATLLHLTLSNDEMALAFADHNRLGP